VEVEVEVEVYGGDMKNKTGRFIFVFTLLGVCTATRYARCEEPLRVIFREKPPYSYTQNGLQKGFLLERTKELLAKAEIKAVFDVVPPLRIFHLIEGNKEPICSFGWYRTPERERFARFSRPIWTDKPQVVVANASSAPRIRQYKTLKNLFADTGEKMILAGGTSYGPEFDALIAGAKVKVESPITSPLNVAKMVSARHADFMLMDQEDFDYLIATEPSLPKEKLVKIKFPDMPAGLNRYILCSQQVSAGVMNRLNRAILHAPLPAPDGPSSPHSPGR
jgi:polar amino acid transport system substrate-binding protein